LELTTMRRRLALCLTIAFLAPLSAAAADSGKYSYCHGYIQKALGAFPIENLDRNGMWLAWNVTVKEVLIAGTLDKDRFQAGRDDFSQQLASSNFAAMEDVVDEECDLGENSSWVWW
jgi:hypothetical protein